MSNYYRYVDRSYALPLDEYERGFTAVAGSREIELLEFTVLKETPKGVWIEDWQRNPFHPQRFILTKARRKYAHPTKEEALKSFIARKRKEASIHRARAERAEYFLKHAEAGDLECRKSDWQLDWKEKRRAERS